VADRGDWRVFYTAFWDDDGVHALSHEAYRVLTTLKGTLPPIGIAVVYDEIMERRCQLSAEQLEEAYRELAEPKPDGQLGWIVRERNVIWVVNGLRFEKSLNPSNQKKHGPYVRKLLAPLGDRPIVRAFQAHYPEWFPPTQTDPDGSNDRLSIGKQLPNDSTGKAKDNVHVGLGKDPIAALPRAAIVGAPPRAPMVDYTTRCVVALNHGMRENPAVRAREVSTSEQLGKVTWEADGIPIELAEQIIAARCAAFKPTGRSKQVFSLLFFDPWVRQAFADRRDAPSSHSASSTPSPSERARVMLVLAKQYGLLRWIGNQEEYDAKVAAAAADPRAWPSFVDDVTSANLTHGIADMTNEFFAVQEIQKRLGVHAA
jgi:hypothetical protein